MPEAVREAAHAMLQKGETMRKQAPIHPPFKRDLTNAFDTSVRNFRSDVKGFVAQGNRGRKERGGPEQQKKRALEMKKINHPWCSHQSMSHKRRHPCKYKFCPGRNRKHLKKKNIPYESPMRCEECSIIHDANMHFCNTTVNKEERNCHEKYHKMKFQYTSPTKKQKPNESI